MAIKVSVIIPFYQTKKGILIQTINSALTQDLSDGYEIIVVDDGSPVSAKSELSDELAKHGDNLKVIEQKNGGAGSARNTGLNHVSHGVEFVAFLDSDDCWLDGHLQNAVSALDLGYDFYFSDFYFSDYKEKSVFERAGKIPLTDHRLIDKQRRIYEYQGDMRDQILIKGNVIGTSNVVFRFGKYPEIRFREEFYNGQDYLFWLDFSNLSSKIAFSSRIECDCGKGLNIYAGAGWGTDRSLQRLINELKLWRFVGKQYAIDKQQATSNKQMINDIRLALTRDILHRISHKKNISKSDVTSIIRNDPLFFLSLPITLTTTIKGKLFR